MAETPFRLHCGYLLENFRTFRSAELFDEICHLHGDLSGTRTDITQSRELKIVRAKVSQHEAAIAHESVVKDRLVSLGELSATVSHELSGPLATILLSTESIRGWIDSQNLTTPQRAVIETHLRRTESSALRMMSINRGVLSFARGSNVELSDFSVRDVARRCADSMSGRLHAAGVALELDFVEGLNSLPVHGSATGIEQVLCNLVGNSIDSIIERRVQEKKSAFNGVVKIEVNATDDRHVHITVRDNGIGLSADTEARMFQPFFTTKPVGAGTGLGLAFSLKTIEQHGGRINAENLADGAAVHCRLPLSQAGR
jgi:C4-dicarboxylate-specific signal transduction histidine kinase